MTFHERDKAKLTAGLDVDLAPLRDNVGLHQAVLGKLTELPALCPLKVHLVASYVTEWCFGCG